MGIITISAIESDTQLVFGIPMLVSLETNIPAIVFYTLDGTIPTTSSDVYIEPIILPTVSTVHLRAFAVSGFDKGYLDITYSTDVTNIYISRRIEGYGAGIVIDAYDVPDVLTDGYSIDDYNIVDIPIRSSDYELIDLEIQDSLTLFRMGIPPVSQLEEASAVDWTPTTPNYNNVFFNPRSLYIIIDGRDGYEDQIISPHVIINRPWGSTRDSVKYLQGKEMFEPQPYISGGHVRTHYNYQKGIAVSYYFDSNETRWIKSIQSFDPRTVPKNIGKRVQKGGPLVFKWIYNKRSMI